MLKGCPPVLKDRARIQKLRTKASLFEAFERVTLRQKAGQNIDPINKKKLNNLAAKKDKYSTDEGKSARGIFHYYNCNSHGHLARNCKQMRKESTKKKSVTSIVISQVISRGIIKQHQSRAQRIRSKYLM